MATRRKSRSPHQAPRAPKARASQASTRTVSARAKFVFIGLAVTAVVLVIVLVVALIDPFGPAKTVVKEKQAAAPQVMTLGSKPNARASSLATDNLLRLVTSKGAFERPWANVIRTVEVYKDRPASLYVMVKPTVVITTEDDQLVGDMCHLALHANRADSAAAVFVQPSTAKNPSILYECKVVS